MNVTKTVFSSDGTKIQIDEMDHIVRLTSPDGDVIEAGYFDTIDTPNGPQEAMTFVLNTYGGRS